MLSYYLGFKNLLKLLDVKYRVATGRINKQMNEYEYAITFKNESYIFSRKDEVATLVLAGLLEYENALKQYDSDVFDHKDVYLNLLSSKGLGSLYIREMEQFNQLFVDPISKEILREMGEPITFLGLLLRSTEMLVNRYHPNPQDMNFMRIRGYERVSGFIYKNLAAAIRQYRNRNISGRSKIEMSPYQVWGDLMSDPSIKLPEDTNPIQNLKEMEIVSFVGEGGRSKETLTKASRVYLPSDMGIVSEGTVDSSDVGVNVYLSANPGIKNLRGLSKEDRQLNMTSLLSTSANLSVGAD
jgi:hypothetical protein